MGRKPVLARRRVRRQGRSVRALRGTRGKGAAAKVQAVTDKKANVLCQFDVTLTENENAQTLEMCDYGTAADNFSNIDQKFFNLYL